MAWIGDTRSSHLAATNASIDSLCYKEFNSPTIFAALLDEEQGGRFQIDPLYECANTPAVLARHKHSANRFLAEEGVAVRADYLQMEQDAAQLNEIIRTVSVIRGNVHFEIRVIEHLSDVGKSLRQVLVVVQVFARHIVFRNLVSDYF
jgi:hypothetical protein